MDSKIADLSFPLTYMVVAGDDDETGFETLPMYKTGETSVVCLSESLTGSPLTRISSPSLFVSSHPGFSFQKAWDEIATLLIKGEADPRFGKVPRFVVTMAECEGGRVWSTAAFKDLRAAMFREAARSTVADIFDLGIQYQIGRAIREALVGTRLEAVPDTYEGIINMLELLKHADLVLEPIEVATLVTRLFKSRNLPFHRFPRMNVFFRLLLTFLASDDVWFVEGDVPPPLALYPGERTKAFLLDASSPDGIRSEPPWFDRGLFDRHMAIKRQMFLMGHESVENHVNFVLGHLSSNQAAHA